MRNVQQGVNKVGYLTKEALLFSKVLDSKNRVYHGISPLGAKTAVLANRHPLITTIHDAIPFIHHRDMDGGHGFWQTYERICIKLCCEKSDRLIFSSEFTKNYVRNKVNFDLYKAKVVKYGVDHSFFTRKVSLEKKRKIIFTVVRWSNLEKFLWAFKTVIKEVPSAMLLLGIKNSFDRDRQEHIRFLIRNIGLENSVKVLHDIPLNKLPDYYHAADVYVSPSLGGFSLTLLEAMACGTPVVAFDLLDVPEYVGKDGVLVKPNDFQGLAEKTINILNSQKLSDSLSERAFERSLDFSWEKMSLETAEVYNDLSSLQ